MGPNGPDQGGYSNTNYVLLGQLVERLDGTDLATALADRVTGPLGLTSTRLAAEDEPGIDGLAGGWTSGDLDGIPLAGDPDTPDNSVISSGVSAGGVMSTSGDLAAFLTALFAGDLISTEALGEMTTIGDSGNGLGVFPVTPGAGDSATTAGAAATGRRWPSTRSTATSSPCSPTTTSSHPKRCCGVSRSSS